MVQVHVGAEIRKKNGDERRREKKWEKAEAKIFLVKVFTKNPFASKSIYGKFASHKKVV